MVSALSLAGGAVGFLFAAFVAWKYVRKGRINNLCWTVGLVLWGVVSTIEALSGPPDGWSATNYRIYYVNSAALVALLGAGTVYLLKEERIGHAFLGYTIVLSVAFAGLAAVAATSPAGLCRVDGNGVCQGGSIGGDGWDASAGYPSVRLATFLLTIPGSIVLIGGALLSWWRTRTLYNILIAAGAAVIALAGVVARGGYAEYIPVGNILAITLMFLGFLFAAEETKVKSPEPERKAAV